MTITGGRLKRGVIKGTMEVSVIGTGNMGSAFVRRARALGLEVYAWNRSRDKLKGLPAQPLPSPAEARGVAAVFVADDVALAKVVEELRADAVALCGTYSPEGAERALEALKARGIPAAAVPVIGSPRNVEQGEALYILGAASDVRPKVAPLFEKAGRVFPATSPMEAVVLKLAFNAVIIGALALLGEATALARGYGVQPSTLKELLRGTVLKDFAERYMDRLVARNPALFSIRNAGKDMRYFVQAALRLGMPVTAASAVKSLYELLAALGRGEEDFARAGYLEGAAWLDLVQV